MQADHDEGRARGRPRDPGIEARVFDAAILLYSQVGWPGFTFEAVARASGIGKPTLYRRWTDRLHLLRETVESRTVDIVDVDSGSIRGDLLEMGQRFLDQALSSHGLAAIQLLLDQARYPEVRDATTAHQQRTIKAARSAVRRAIEEGQLPPSVSPTLLDDLLFGALHNHVITTPPALRSAMEREAGAYLVQVVDAALAAVGAVPAHS
jgi:AcrR family transcriptional regulator